MIVYHGTTLTNARSITQNGFVPHSRRVWFTRSRKYAKRRSENKAKALGDRPFILTCELDLDQLRQQQGLRTILQQGNIIIVFGAVPASVLRDFPKGLNLPRTPADTAAWVNKLLALEPHKGVSPKHPGVDRLARWLDAHLLANPDAKVDEAKLVGVLEQCLPGNFPPGRLTPQALATSLQTQPSDPTPAKQQQPPQTDPHESEALDCLTSAKPKRRIRGLRQMAQLKATDLFDWCALMLADEDNGVRRAALETMSQCDQIDTNLVAPLANPDQDQGIRAAAIGALAAAGKGAVQWLWRGLTDPSPHVRRTAARQLENFEPQTHRQLFETALYDPDPKVAATAKRLTAGKGFSKPT